LRLVLRGFRHAWIASVCPSMDLRSRKLSAPALPSCGRPKDPSSASRQVHLAPLRRGLFCPTIWEPSAVFPDLLWCGRTVAFRDYRVGMILKAPPGRGFLDSGGSLGEIGAGRPIVMGDDEGRACPLRQLQKTHGGGGASVSTGRAACQASASAGVTAVTSCSLSTHHFLDGVIAKSRGRTGARQSR